MTKTHPFQILAGLIASLVLLAVGAMAAMATNDGDSETIVACINNAEGSLRVVQNEEQCRRSETPIQWNSAGPQGPLGPPGPGTPLAYGRIMASGPELRAGAVGFERVRRFDVGRYCVFTSDQESDWIPRWYEMVAVATVASPPQAPGMVTVSGPECSDPDGRGWQIETYDADGNRSDTVSFYLMVTDPN